MTSASQPDPTPASPEDHQMDATYPGYDDLTQEELRLIEQLAEAEAEVFSYTD